MQGSQGLSPTRKYAVCLYVNGAYPPRPSAEIVLFIGPSTPTGKWRDQDEWRNNT